MPNETMNLFSDDVTQEFASEKVKRDKTISSKTSVRSMRLHQKLFLEKNKEHYVFNAQIEIPVLKRLADKIGRRELYCLIWTVAHDPPFIRGRDAVMYIRYISYHAQRIMETSEYKKMLLQFDDEAMTRMEDRIDEFICSENTE